MLCFEDIKKNVRSFGGCALTFVKDGLEKEDVSYSRVSRRVEYCHPATWEAHDYCNHAFTSIR